jgi:nucleoid-associated protein YgaU
MNTAHRGGQDADQDVGLLYLVGAISLIGTVLLATVGPPRIPTGWPHLPNGVELELLLRTPTAAQLDGALFGLTWLAWLVWALCVWIAFTALFRAALVLAERAGATWLRPARRLSDLLTLPAVRRTVDGLLAGLLVARVATTWVAPSALAESMPVVAQVVAPADADQGSPAPDQADPASQVAELGPNDLLYTVQAGDSVGRLAAHFYGDWQEYTRIVEANQERVQPDGRTLNETGTIHPGWQLLVPEPTRGVRTDPDGARWYTVERGDSLWKVSAELLGDGQRWPEVFSLNQDQARLPDGHVLRNPNLIWPGLELELPVDAAADTSPVEDAPAPKTAPASPPTANLAPPPAMAPPPTPTTADIRPSPATPPPVPTQEDLTEPATAPPVTSAPVATPTAESHSDGATRPYAPLAGAAAAGGMAAAAIAAGLIVRRRRPAPDLSQPENDLSVEGGYAELDPARVASQRLLEGEGGDLADLVAGRLAQAYAHHFAQQQLLADERSALTEVRLLATRHGWSSTTLMLTAPLAARPLLLRPLPAVAELAFGDRVDVEGLVSHEGDVLIRLTGVARQAAHLRAAAATETERDELWPAPRLVPLGLLNDRQTLAANWDGLGHVFIGAPLGQGAGTALVAILASLVARSTPAELGLYMIGQPSSLARELQALPHLLRPIADSREPETVQAVIDGVRLELERREAERLPDEPELVLVVREIGDLDAEALTSLGPVLLDGPRSGIRLLAASERTGENLVRRCPALSAFGTRLVLQATDEDESVAVLGASGAEYLAAGGQLLVRLEGRVPMQAYGFRVHPDQLARLVEVTHDAAGYGAATPGDLTGVATASVVDSDQTGSQPSPEAAAPEEAAAERDSAEPDVQEPSACSNNARSGDVSPESMAVSEAVDSSHRNGKTAPPPPATSLLRSELLDRLRAAPFRVNCLRARELRHTTTGKLVYPSAGSRQPPFELLFLVAVHRPGGVRGELVMDSLWPNGQPKDPASEVRKLRFRLREHFKRTVPDLEGDVILNGGPNEPFRLNATLVASDVHEFLELLRLAQSAPDDQAIITYEAALGLYRGDLLDGPDVPLWWWLYDGPQVAVELRADYRRLQQEARRRLANLYAASGGAGNLLRAQELYVGLTGELADDEQLWATLFRTHRRRGDVLGFEASVRRLRSALVEFADDDDNPEQVRVPPGLLTIIEELRAELAEAADHPVKSPTPGR